MYPPIDGSSAIAGSQKGRGETSVNAVTKKAEKMMKDPKSCGCAYKDIQPSPIPPIRYAHQSFQAFVGTA